MNEALAKILAILQLAAKAAEPLVAGIPPAAAVDSLAELLISIAQKANEAHVAVTGKPIDLDLLQPIDPVE